MSEEKHIYAKDAGNEITPIEDMRFRAKFPFVLDTTWKDSWGNDIMVARITPLPFKSREYRLCKAFSFTPELIHLLSELERIYFPLDGEGSRIFDRFDEILDEIKNAYKPDEGIDK